MTSQGSMAIIAQSGTIGAAMAGWAEEDAIGFTSVVALGNKSGVGEIELLDYFADDSATKVIALNIEGVADGTLFIETAKRALAKKPVVVLKPGRTTRGAEAAASHTKSIAGSDQIFDAVCRQIGLIRAEGIAEFYDFAKILGMLTKPAGNRLMVITSSGGSGILAADTADDLGILIEKPEQTIIEQLRTVLPNQCVLSNPLDLTGDATAQRYLDALEVVVQSETVDAYLVIFGDPIEHAAETIAKIRSMTSKPILAAFLGGGEVQKREVPLLNVAGVPVFPTPERAVRALDALLRKR
jgi:acyl-CoA synthetase (NDP forming)